MGSAGKGVTGVHSALAKCALLKLAAADVASNDATECSRLLLLGNNCHYLVRFTQNHNSSIPHTLLSHSWCECEKNNFSTSSSVSYVPTAELSCQSQVHVASDGRRSTTLSGSRCCPSCVRCTGIDHAARRRYQGRP